MNPTTFTIFVLGLHLVYGSGKQVYVMFVSHSCMKDCSVSQ